MTLRLTSVHKSELAFLPAHVGRCPLPRPPSASPSRSRLLLRDRRGCRRWGGLGGALQHTQAHAHTSVASQSSCLFESLLPARCCTRRRPARLPFPVQLSSSRRLFQQALGHPSQLQAPWRCRVFTGTSGDLPRGQRPHRALRLCALYPGACREVPVGPMCCNAATVLGLKGR